VVCEKPLAELLIRDPSLLVARYPFFRRLSRRPQRRFPDTFKQLYRAIYEYLSEGDFSRPKIFAGFEDGHEELLLCEAILQVTAPGLGSGEKKPNRVLIT
jgi:hypothetical protein